MSNTLEYDVIKCIKFILVGIALFYLNTSSIKILFWPSIIIAIVHVGIFIFDLKHRIDKGKWRYKPY